MMGHGIDLLIYAIAVGIFLALAWVKFDHHIRKLFSGIEKEKHSGGGIFKWAVSSKEFYRRLLVTVGILIIITLVGWCHLPGLDPQAGMNIFSSGTQFDILSILGRSGDRGFSILDLGLLPFYTSCILVQIVFLLIKKLRIRLFQGGQSRLTVIRTTFAVTILLTLLEALGLMYGLNAQGLLQPGFTYQVGIVLSLMGGTSFLIVAAYTITRFGLGHGFGLILLFAFLRNLISAATSGVINGIILFIVVFLFLAGIAWVATNLTHQAGISTADSQKKFSLPMRPAWLGAEPVYWASFFILLPATLSQFIQNEALQGAASWFAAGWFSHVIRLILVTLLCYGYMAILIRPKYLLEMLQKHGFSVDHPANQSPEKFLGKIRNKTALFSSAILFLMGLMATGLMDFFGWPYDVVTKLLGVSSLLVAAGVIFDLTGRLKFFREREAQGSCALAYVAVDEMEATIKKEFLRTQGVPALIEPLRYSWGMPIRTIIDEYRIHVPAGQSDQARLLLSQV